ncbi:MAG: chromosome condensation regulator [Hyperionvirus sp.]|uniref:Chromosome condensation regulator n=1 Tax=Hyperionvirus sp. TaxID=2487770 RepID=A0A3G5A7S0_9VIRU|nr:MAG: chromosome condensation regulator [Hyperionvirus sp.]
MNFISLFRNLPIDLQYKIIGYNHEMLFLRSELVGYDWFKLIRMNFGLQYSKDSSSGDQMMKVYLGNCRSRSKIVCGFSFTIVRLEDGTLMGSGYNELRGLGIEGKNKINKFEPIPKIPKNVAEVACGYGFTIIRLTDGTLMSCGSNASGGWGRGNTDSRNEFREISGIPKNITQVVCGKFHRIIRLTDGTLMGCGDNYAGELGLGDNKKKNLFEEIRGIPKNIVDVACGGFHTIIRLTDGALMGCGSNSHGQLGNVIINSKNTFEEIANVPKNIVDVACGEFHTIIRLTDGTLMGCGVNGHGQLGLGDYQDRHVFTKIEKVKDVAEIACASYGTIIRLMDGTLMSCGWFVKGRGKMCLFDSINNIPKNITEVSCGRYHAVLRLSDGTLMGFGNNACGALGLGDYRDRTEFEAIPGIICA